MEVITICWIFSWIAVSVAAIYRYFVLEFDYFINQSIPGPKPVFFFGTWWNFWNQDMRKLELQRYKKYGRVYGAFHGRTPNLYVADPELLRKVMIKDFDCFVNRRTMTVRNKYLNNNVSNMHDQMWKDTRAVLTPGFTTGKIRKMVDGMHVCAEDLVGHLKELIQAGRPVVNLKEKGTGYALDVIASCAYGTKISSLRNPENPFVSTALKVFQADTVNSPLFGLTRMYPEIAKLSPPTVFGGTDFFVNVCKKIIETRSQDPRRAERNDFLEVMLRVAKDESTVLNPLKDQDILLGQVLIFLLAGFETTATTLALTVHNLATNPEIQDRLREEIRSEIKKNGGLSYELIQSMPYLDMCLSETLRLYPPAYFTERLCNKTVEYPNVKIKKGTVVTIPIYAIHHDPKNYPDPDKYDPERFSPEVKAKRDPMLYTPFGQGPRNCIGMRFALEEIKLGLIHLLNNFRFYAAPETKNPPEIVSSLIGMLLIQKLPVGIEILENPPPLNCKKEE